jgi:hypothetical protein
LLPETNSSRTNLHGPEPVKSVICCIGSVRATRSGMMKQTCAWPLPSTSSSGGNGRVSLIWMVLSSAAVMPSTERIMICAAESRAAQRWIEATQSCARTGVPSWNLRPSRSLMRQVRLSSLTVWPSAICGFGRNCASTP